MPRSGVDLPAWGQTEHRRRGSIDRDVSLISPQIEGKNAVEDIEVCYDPVFTLSVVGMLAALSQRIFTRVLK